MTEGLAAKVGQGRRPLVRRPWPRLPAWFWVAVVVGVVAFVVLGGIAVQKMLDVEEQPLFERRPPPEAGEQSHAVGRVIVSERPPQPVRCGVVDGLRVAGDDIVRPLLVDAIGGLCRRLGNADPALSRGIVAAARTGTIVSFGVFEATGVDSTTLAGPPPRVVINTRYAGAFKGYLLQVLAHELFHAGGVAVTAEEEFAARSAEHEICRAQPEITSVRGCAEARDIVRAGHDSAVRQLRDAGYR